MGNRPEETAPRRCHGSDLPTDVLTEILLRFPPSSRRRARLVCRLWRDIIGEPATDSSQAVALLWGISSGVAYIVDDLSTGRRRELWRSPSGRPVTTNLHNDWQLVGTCNGLLCICHNGGATIGGEITLVNPATSETLPVPPLPCNGHFRRERLCRREWDRAYNLAYHPKSGRYKVVHVPCSFDGVYEYDAVHVLALGEGAWREVPAPGGAGCNLSAGIISVDGVTYWVTGHDHSAKILSFDLDNEHIAASTISLPYMPGRHGGYNYNLTEVHGRLGVIFGNPSGKTEAWAWHEEAGRWTRVAILTCECQEIPRPHFARGEYFLMCEGQLLYSYLRNGTLLPSGLRLVSNYVNVIRKDKGTLVAKMNDGGYKFEYRAFAYVKTSESLRVYAAN